ncbi:MAG: AAA family ATPase [Abitibacteriaceae bacterium]|nr:AAA family ATPase [Abditibacteriaceae bacterium]MBV9867148.1 AAA family ATPase [Abditibacteriaceae bacterium]
MTTEPFIITDNLDQLLAVLPDGLADTIPPSERGSLVEIVLDLGRKPEARFTDRFAYLHEEPITREDLDYVEARLGAFGNDNRAGIPATLHRISAMRNRRGVIVGLTLRVGRAVMGIVDILRDIIESGESLLLMGRPGLGKTTLLREMARVVADELGKRVVIVDTSNEIAGDGDVPHPAIGRARRMQVPRVEQQHDVMIEAVENHMPEVVVIDEIGRSEETMAARTIAERGVQLVATVHGNTLDNLLANPTMSDLIGGIQAVTLSDEEARRRRTQKTVLERKAPPTFGVVVEMIERDKIAVRRPVAEVVDALLRGQAAPPELRWRDDDGNVQVERPSIIEAQARSQHDFEMRGEYGGHSFRGGSGGGRGDGRRGRQDGNGGRPGWGNERGSSRQGRVRSNRLVDELGEEYTPRNGSFTGTYDFPGSATSGMASKGRLAGTANALTQIAEPEVEDELTEESELRDTAEVPEAEFEEKGHVTEEPVDVSRVRRVYPFGVSRSRLTRAIKHLGLPLSVTRTWHDADAVLMLSGSGGLSTSTSLLREAREMRLPIISVRGNTYAQILSRLNDLFSAQLSDSHMTAREMAIQEARNAVQHVLAEAEPVELRPQAKTMRRLQHQLAARYHLRSYSVGREPQRRVRFLPSIGR